MAHISRLCARELHFSREHLLKNNNCINLVWKLRRCGQRGANGNSLLGARSASTHFLSFLFTRGWGGHQHLTNEKTEAQRVYVTDPTSHSRQSGRGGWVLGSNPYRCSLCLIFSSPSKLPRHTVGSPQFGYLFLTTLGGVFQPVNYKHRLHENA